MRYFINIESQSQIDLCALADRIAEEDSSIIAVFLNEIITAMNHNKNNGQQGEQFRRLAKNVVKQNYKELIKAIELLNKAIKDDQAPE